MFIVSIAIISSTYHRTQVEHDRQLMQEKKENIYRILLETTFEGVAIHQKGVLIDTNIGFESMFGYQQAELIGMNMFELIPEQYRDYARQNI
ncbi:MAG: PAS domain S-box protein [Chloroflexi bacterium]|uniref:PAS domain S-box protein n=1 Tax=Candidatus Chlorohelix allophototropha TaxID=3003348 RepID=A0A8T7LVZ5_9CHLR|nr:PAS domain S-box protein [Chloroflexota bacterium]WJW65555.1 PAS domain S-box protein [Chloroflexota bacterium L227-S17]